MLNAIYFSIYYGRTSVTGQNKTIEEKLTKSYLKIQRQKQEIEEQSENIKEQKQKLEEQNFDLRSGR